MGALIVDLGMHRGDDTRYYLSQGFNVLAVEANPELARLVSSELAYQVRSGQLEILNVAVADHSGVTDFYTSEEDLWGSTKSRMADRGFGAMQARIRVPCTTLASLLRDRPNPYYVKIDVEGEDVECIASLGELGRYPNYLSFEADLTNPLSTHRALDLLEGYGYQRFKLVNQATHGFSFTKHMSGPLGEDTQGPWRTAKEVRECYGETIRKQAARIEYSATGRIFGFPLALAHKPLKWIYNTPTVTRARSGYASRRGQEMGGWFDIHAAM